MYVCVYGGGGGHVRLSVWMRSSGFTEHHQKIWNWLDIQNRPRTMMGLRGEIP